MKIWILLLIAGLLLLWGVFRERFEPTNSIRRPPYSDDEKVRIYGMLPSADMAVLMTKVPEGASTSAMTDEERERAKRVAAGSLLTPVIGDFFTSVFGPATELLTQTDIDTFFESRPESDIREIEKRAVKIYFIDQSGVGTSTGSGYADVLAELGQGPGYLYTRGTGGTGGTGATGGTGGTGGTTTGTTAGGTTGGSSDTSAAPNAGPVGASGSGQSVYGPVFTSLGSPVGGGGDTSGTNRYPELLGGVGDTTSVRTRSGIRNPSQNWLLSQSGALPSTASMGSDANSRFFPNSRVPGDQDLIPDPYRLSRNYSTANYSSKTDPVPFLTDFSAFFK